jgi:hypothetical protein
VAMVGLAVGSGAAGAPPQPRVDGGRHRDGAETGTKTGQRQVTRGRDMVEKKGLRDPLVP